MFCPKCGKENSDGAVFCSSCGTNFSDQQSPQKTQKSSSPEVRTYSTKSKVWWWILSVCLLIGALASSNLPEKLRMEMVLSLLIIAIIVNPLLNGLVAKIKLISIPSIRFLLGIIFLVVMLVIGANKGPSIDSDFQSKFDELGSPKIMYQCGEDVGYLAGIGTEATFNHLIDKAKEECYKSKSKSKEFKILQRKEK